MFPEIWSTIQPAFAEVQAGKGSVHTRNQLLPLLRHGNVEDAWFDFSFNEIPLEDGSVGGILNMARETTARMQTKSELRRVHAIIDSITQETQDLIAAVDTEFRLLYFNDAYSREYENLWDHPVMIGDDLLESLATWPDEQQKTKEMWGRALTGESFNVTMEFGPSKAESRVYDLRFSPVRDADGNQIGRSPHLPRHY